MHELKIFKVMQVVWENGLKIFLGLLLCQM